MNTKGTLTCSAIALLCAVGNAQAQAAQSCGQVTGSLASPNWTNDVGLPTNVACAGSNSFLFVVADPDVPEDVSFSVSAAFNSPMIAEQAVTLDLGMIFGLTGGFQQNATWTFSLAGSGLVFDTTAPVNEVSDTFATLSGNEARFVGFDATGETATFELVLDKGLYDTANVPSVGAQYTMMTAVPEPGAWLSFAVGFGILAGARRKRLI
jgi:hypothetical protein